MNPSASIGRMRAFGGLSASPATVPSSSSSGRGETAPLPTRLERTNATPAARQRGAASFAIAGKEPWPDAANTMPRAPRATAAPIRSVPGPVDVLARQERVNRPRWGPSDNRSSTATRCAGRPGSWRRSRRGASPVRATPPGAPAGSRPGAGGDRRRGRAGARCGGSGGRARPARRSALGARIAARPPCLKPPRAPSSGASWSSGARGWASPRPGSVGAAAGRRSRRPRPGSAQRWRPWRAGTPRRGKLGVTRQVSYRHVGPKSEFRPDGQRLPERRSGVAWGRSVAKGECRSGTGPGFRFHRLLLAPTPFGDRSLVRELRRIGRPGTFRTEPFATEEEAVAASENKAHEEQRRG